MGIFEYLEKRFWENRKILLEVAKKKEERKPQKKKSGPDPLEPVLDPYRSWPPKPLTAQPVRTDVHGKEPEWSPLHPKRKIVTPEKICPTGGFTAHNPILVKFAETNAENFALVLMFAPLSAQVTMFFYTIHFPILAYILQKFYKDSYNVTPKQLKAVWEYLRDRITEMEGKKWKGTIANIGSKLTVAINSWKYKTITDIWNNRRELFNQYKEIMEKAKGGEHSKVFNLFRKLFNTYKEIKGVASVKAGFTVQVLTGSLGCIDVHNRDILMELGKYLIKTNRKEEGEEMIKLIDNLDNLEGEDYYKLMSLAKKHGFGSKNLWNLWVDFTAGLWSFISQRDPIYAKLDKVLDPEEMPWKVVKHLSVEKQIPPAYGYFNPLGLSQQKPVPPEFARVATGAPGASALSALHLTPLAFAGLTDDPVTWRRLKALYKKGFDPSGSVYQLAQEIPGKYRDIIRTGGRGGREIDPWRIERGLEFKDWLEIQEKGERIGTNQGSRNSISGE